MVVFAAGFIAISQSQMGGTSGMFRVLFLAVPVIMIVIALAMVASAVKFAKAPVRRAVFAVVDERIDVSSSSTGRRQSHATRTRYYATLQARDGSRIEYETYDWLAGRIAAGDIGVAFTKGDMLIDFLRLEA